jgi:rod shape determining protein RodA
MLLSQYLYQIKKNDWTLIIASLFLSFFGLAAIYSVALGQGQGEFLNFKKQVVWLLVGLAVLYVVANINYHHWRRLGWWGYWLGLLLLILVLTPLGSTIRGARGWFSLGFLNFQPVELMKIFLLIVLADVYRQYVRTIHKFSQLILIGLIVCLPLILVVIQPDFGSAMILFFTWLIPCLFIIKNKWHIVMIFAGMISLLLISWFFIFADYQKDRIRIFLNPAADPLFRGYNVRQSIIAVGSGGLLGKGLGFGSQSQLKFIPESQTDFIFAVIAEELGFVGVLLIVGFFFLVFYRLAAIARNAPDDFGMFLSLLVLTLIFVQVFINIGMGMGLLPVTGISLPFVSYGGSFLITIFILVGLALSVYRAGAISRRCDLT